MKMDEQCCRHGCNGGACEACPCCCAGFCISGHDNDELERVATQEQKDYWLEVKTMVEEGKWYV